MALVLLVVVGHAWTLLPKNAVNEYLYDFLYAWHVPAFVFVTGYLSRSFSYTSRRLWRLVRTVAVPYVIFECGLALFRIYVGGEELNDLFRDPHWPMWYLSALFFWRLLTPLFTHLPARIAVTMAVLISLGAGLYAGNTLDVARVLGLLPFFVLGLTATPARLERLREPRARSVAVGVFMVIAVLSVWTDQLARTEWLYYRSRYDELDVSNPHAVAIRASLLVIGTLGAWSFLALVPRVGGWFTRLGTLVVYLCHGFFVLGAEYAGYPAWAETHPVMSLILTTLAAAGLAVLLAWGPVARLLTHLVDPFGGAERQVGVAVRLAEAPGRAEEIAEAMENVAERMHGALPAPDMTASRGAPGDRGGPG